MDRRRDRLLRNVLTGAGVAAVACLGGAGSVASAASAGGPSCDRPTSTTLIETGKLRVYRLPNGSLIGCLKTTGRSRQLDKPAEPQAMAADVDPASIAVSAPLVAYAFTQYYFDSHKTSIRVMSLRTGKVVRDCPAGGSLAPHTFPHVIRIVLNARGAVAWSAEESATGASRDEVVACDSAEPRTLDAGDGIELGSLSLKDSTVGWTDAGARRSAYLE